MPALVRSDTARGVTTITLDSPDNRNALSSALISQLLAALADAEADDATRVVVLDHTGPVFCSGADLKETAAALTGDAPPGGAPGPASGGWPASEGGPSGAGSAPAGIPASRLGDVLSAIWDSRKPVVARVAGPARAGGLGVIAAADVAVCVDTATFAFSEVRIGVVPAVISATVLARLSPRAAAELYLTGDPFDGARAAAVGLVTAAVPADQLNASVRGYTDSLLRGAPGALAATKQVLRGGGRLAERLAPLTELSMRHFGSAEGREGILAFREKRDARWVPTD